MVKKNKNKSVDHQKKAKATPDKIKTGTPGTTDPKDIETRPSENKESPPKMAVEKAKTHLDQMLALSTMPLRLDHQIRCIKALQQELFKLHLKQVLLLDGCADFLQELNAVQPTDACEEKMVLETFREVKSKLSDVFERYLPAQLDMLKQESKILQMSSEMISK
ncbi:uncharacterized protein LOC122619280 [Drosophila teissieri]|uniref:uncharacterized protein LOC122619280 n=1 Tax=Drosophila teissieri TaxID=7243 RepID=UPI001CB9DBA4|nr:uncharacterized protein LOC122619280 [Drosophila teissieri]